MLRCGLKKSLYILFIVFVFQIFSYGQETGNEDYVIRAGRVENNSIQLDGILSEPEWSIVDSITNYIQRVPDFGSPATENTTVKMLYDENHFYVGVTCYYHDIKTLVAWKLAHREDIWSDDVVALVFDTFFDKTKAYCFITNAYGAKQDGFIDGIGRYDENWKDVWEVKTSINRNNWTAELKIPLRILRFPCTPQQTWGFNMFRLQQKKNEIDDWHPIPPQHNITNMTLAGRIIGIQGIKNKRNLQVRPYILLGGTTEKNNGNIDRKTEMGLNLKYVPLPNFSVDLTYNTDFAQIESDDEQINLSRFSLFYPEKRDFFMENAQLFDFGRQKIIQPFFSRRIGIHEGNPVPVLGGARVTGKIGRSNIGFLSISTEKTSDLPLTNYTALRIRQDILKNSNVGFIVTNVQSQDAYNRCWGVDSEVWLSKNSVIKGFYSAVYPRDIQDKNSTVSLYYSLNRDLFQFDAGYMEAGRNYSPASGFVFLNDFKDYNLVMRKSFRPTKYGIRKIDFIGRLDYTYTYDNNDFMKQNIAEVTTEFESGNWMFFSVSNVYENLYEDFNIYQDVMIPIGKYTYNNASIKFMFDKRRRISGSVAYLHGSFYDGNQKRLSLDGLVNVSKHLMIGQGIEINDVHLPHGDFTTTIGRLRINLFFNSNLSLKTYLQYNSQTKRISSNIRFHLLHGNDNDLYLVYNNISSTESHRWQSKTNTAALKLNYRIYL